MHAELMQSFAREIVNDRIREADTARAARSQSEDRSNGRSRFLWTLTRRRSVTVAV